ncbi:MAG: Hsp20/alpha crystallin family protein [Methanobacterium sp.]
MTNEVTKSAEEMKKNMHKKLHKKKSGVEGKQEDIKEKMVEAKETASETKEDISSRIEEVEEGASEKKEEIEEKVGEVKEEAEEQKEKLEKESKKEGMTPAEKLLNDLVSRLKEGKGQIDEVISDYTTTEPETSEASKKPKKALKPLVDVLETNDTITLIADISGVKKDDIDIGISKNSVEITAMYKEEPEVEDAKFTQKERSYGKTHRKIPLSTEIKVKEAKAKYKTCQLTITLPKKVEDITKVNIED